MNNLDLGTQKFSLDSRISDINKKNKKGSKLKNNISDEYVKVNIDAANQLSFTTSLISSQERSKPINIVDNRNRNNSLNRNKKAVRSNSISNYTKSLNKSSYDFHQEIENSIQEKIKKDNLSPNKSSIENIFTSSINILKESYDYISNNNKSL